MKRYFLAPALLPAVLLTFLSCQRRPLTEPWEISARVTVRVDWSACMQEPSGMTVVLYDAEGLEVDRSVSRTGEPVCFDLLPGTYTALVFSYSESEWKSLTLNDISDFSTASACLTALNPSVLSSGALAEGFTVTDGMVDAWQSEGSGTEVTLRPEDRVLRLEARIHFTGVHNLRSLRLDVSGMARSVRLSDGMTGPDRVTRTLSDNWSLKTDPSDATVGTVRGAVRTLGLPDGEHDPVILPTRPPERNEALLTLLLRDGKTLLDTTFRVGNRFRLERTPDRLDFRKTECTLVLELGADTPIPLPEVKPEGGSGSGFNATVVDWDRSDPVEIDIR